MQPSKLKCLILVSILDISHTAASVIFKVIICIIIHKMNSQDPLEKLLSQ